MEEKGVVADGGEEVEGVFGLHFSLDVVVRQELGFSSEYVVVITMQNMIRERTDVAPDVELGTEAPGCRPMYKNTNVEPEMYSHRAGYKLS